MPPRKSTNRPNQWRPAVAVKPRVYEVLSARAEQLGISRSEVIERLVRDAICAVCGRVEVYEPRAATCGADECVRKWADITSHAVRVQP